MSTPKKTFVAIDTSVESSEVWAVDLESVSYYYDPEVENWKSIEKTTTRIRLTPGYKGLYATDKEGNFYARYLPMLCFEEVNFAKKNHKIQFSPNFRN